MTAEVRESKSSPEKKTKTKRPLFNYGWIVSNIPFILYLAVLAILYIYNGHYADELTRSISKSEKSVKELEYEYKTLKSEVIYRSRASELIKVVEPMGLKEVKEPPMRLTEDSLKKTPNN
jgi:cell division protein FtsL